MDSNVELTPKQQSMYNKLKEEVDNLPPPANKRKYITHAEYLEANRERSRLRYERIKNDESARNKLREYNRIKGREYYKKKKAEEEE